MQHIFAEKTAFTSDAIDASSQAVTGAYLTVTGPGPVYIDQLHNGQYTAFPESTFNGPTAQRVDLRRGPIKVRVAAATATTVELTW